MFRVRTTSVWPTATTAITATLVLIRVNVRAGQEIGYLGGEEGRDDDDDQDEDELAELFGPDVPEESLASARSTVGGADGCPMAAASTRSAVASSRPRIAICRPSRMTRIRSLVARTSGRSELIRMIASPSRGKLVDDLVDLGLRPDVDPPRGLVEDQNARARVQPFAQDHLLLVTARERRDGHSDRRRADPQPLAITFRGGLLGRRWIRPESIQVSRRGSAARYSPRSTAGR